MVGAVHVADVPPIVVVVVVVVDGARSMRSQFTRVLFGGKLNLRIIMDSELRPPRPRRRAEWPGPSNAALRCAHPTPLELIAPGPGRDRRVRAFRLHARQRVRLCVGV